MADHPLIAQAFEAFTDDARRPPPLTLRGANDVDGYDLPSPFDPDADRIDDGYVERFAFWGLAHLDPQSWRHYLPALIAYALRHPDDPAMATEALVLSLRPPDWFPPRLGSLTPAQEAVVREFLETLALGPADTSSREIAQQALDEWWLPDARARPTADQIGALRGAPIAWRTVDGPRCRLEVPDTLPTSGARDLPTESRRVQTWGGVVCGDVHVVVAVNAWRDRTLEDTVADLARFFGVTTPATDARVPGARRARRFEGVTPVGGRAGEERVVTVAAETDAGVVTLTIRAADRPDVAGVMARIAASLVLAR